MTDTEIQQGDKGKSYTSSHELLLHVRAWDMSLAASTGVRERALPILAQQA